MERGPVSSGSMRAALRNNKKTQCEIRIGKTTKTNKTLVEQAKLKGAFAFAFALLCFAL
jgi:hypothetical protein